MLDPPSGGGVPLLLLSCSSSSHSRRCRIESWKPTWMDKMWPRWMIVRMLGQLKTCKVRRGSSQSIRLMTRTGVADGGDARRPNHRNSTLLSARRNSNGQLYSAMPCKRRLNWDGGRVAEVFLPHPASNCGFTILVKMCLTQKEIAHTFHNGQKEPRSKVA